MLFVVVFSLLALSAMADGDLDEYTFVPPVGSGSGTSFSITGDGPITAIRVWENYNGYIVGLQFRFGDIWSSLVGRELNTVQELELYHDEKIIQMSGKYTTSAIYSLVFITNKGRFLMVGQPLGYSFNMYPTNEHAELRIVSGRSDSLIRSIATHWGPVKEVTDDTNN